MQSIPPTKKMTTFQQYRLKKINNSLL